MEQKINIKGLFADDSSSYCCPEEPKAGDLVKLRFRTKKDDVDQVLVYMQEDGTKRAVSRVMKHIVPSHEEEACAGRLDQAFDFYEYEFAMGEKKLWYYFKVKKGNESLNYHKLGAVHGGKPELRYCYVLRPGLSVPDWAKGAVYYQIFTDRFSNGDLSNDVRDGEYLYVDNLPVHKAKAWGEDILKLDVGHFYGGDLQGVINKLDHIKRLGVEVIWFNPIFVSPSNHKYDTQDYDHIDPHYGKIVEDIPEGTDYLVPDAYSLDAGGIDPTVGSHQRGVIADNREALRYINAVTNPKNLEASDALFATLCEEAHKRGIRIILDGVFNHCGSFNRWMDREGIYEGKEGEFRPGAYKHKDSPYNSYFRFTADDWPNNKHYSSWWNMDTLPKLNYEESEELCEDILRIAGKWLKPPYCADGWRLDVGADLGDTPEFNHYFWKRFRKAVKEANPDALIFAEHFFDSTDWLQGDEWDSIMNYEAFMDPVSWFLTGLEKHSYEYHGDKKNNGELFWNTMKYSMCQFHRGALLSALNEHSNHDHSRFMTRTNCTPGKFADKGPAAASKNLNFGIFREGYVISMTWPGAPGIYYGDETGVCGWTDPDNRRTYPWRHQNYELIDFFEHIGSIHKWNPALKTGSLKFLGAGDGLIMYGRMQDTNRLAVAVNNLDHERQVEIPVWELGIPDGYTMKRILLTYESGFNAGELVCKVEAGMVVMKLPAYSSVILKYCEER